MRASGVAGRSADERRRRVVASAADTGHAGRCDRQRLGRRLRTEVARMLRENAADVMDELARRFEAAVIREALDFTRGRKVEAAERLGIGRNTITRKIQELNLEP